MTTSLLRTGQRILVKGSAKFPYELTKIGDDAYMCTCPAWRNVGGPIDVRTCKHLRKELGDAAETERCGKAFSVVKVPTASKAAVIDSVTLAHTYSPDVDPTGWLASEKLDGVRALWDGSKFVSRQGNVFHAPEFFTRDLPSTPLDGELFAGRGAFQQTVSVVRRLDGGALWASIEFVVFDAPTVPGSFSDRLRFLRSLPDHPHMRVLHQSPCDGPEHLETVLDFVIANGGEGVMLRHPDSLHEGGRSHTLLKVKRMHDAEAVVVGHTAGKGRHKGSLGAIQCRYEDGTLFEIGTGFSDAERDNPPPLNSVVTFRFQERTKAGSFRFPSFIRIRTDI